MTKNKIVNKKNWLIGSFLMFGAYLSVIHIIIFLETPLFFDYLVAIFMPIGFLIHITDDYKIMCKIDESK